MGYREDHDAAQARVSALERELAEAKQEIDSLSGRRAMVLASNSEQALAKSSGQYSKFLGGPKAIALEERIEVELSADDFLELVQLIRRHTGDPGTVSAMTGSVTWQASTNKNNNAAAAAIQVTMTSLRGTTTIQVDHNLRPVGTVLFGALGGGVGINLAVQSAVWLSVAGMPLVAVAAAPSALIATVLGCRALFRRVARKRAVRASDLLAELTQAVRRMASERQP